MGRDTEQVVMGGNMILSSEGSGRATSTLLD